MLKTLVKYRSIVALVFWILGFLLIGAYSNWQTAIGVLALLFANNIEQQDRIMGNINSAIDSVVENIKG